jgi:hypothetical protein
MSDGSSFKTENVQHRERHVQRETSHQTETTMIHKSNGLTRREFIREGAAVGIGLAAMGSIGTVASCAKTKRTSTGMPTIKLGDFQVSRLILGSNPFWGFWHGNPRKPKEYSQEGRKAVMDAAAAQGITAIWVPGYKEWIALWNEYKEKGGKLETWIGQPDGYKDVSLEDQITACAQNGGKAVCIQGENVDEAMGKKDYEKLKRWLGLIRDFGLPAGLASHHPENILASEERGLPAEFYHLTLGVPNSFEGSARENTLNTVRHIDKPMVVYKIFGAGRFEPKDAIPYVLNAVRRKDGICVGVDNPEQLMENAGFVRRLT